MLFFVERFVVLCSGCFSPTQGAAQQDVTTLQAQCMKIAPQKLVKSNPLQASPAPNMIQPSPSQLRSPWQAAKPSSTDESLTTLFSLEWLQVHSKARCLPGAPQLSGAWLNYVGRGACLKRVRLDELLRGDFHTLRLEGCHLLFAGSCRSGLEQ